MNTNTSRIYLMFTATGKPVMIGKDQQWTDTPDRDQHRLEKAEIRTGEKCEWRFDREVNYCAVM